MTAASADPAALLAEILRRSQAADATEATIARMLADLARHPKQLAFVTDPARMVAGHPGRRGGKSEGACRKLLIAALRHANSWAVYVAPTRGLARDYLWRPLLDANDRYGLGGVANKTELTLTLPNGATVKLAGADHEEECEKLRGYKLAIVIIDEAGTFKPWLKYFLQEVLRPALADLRGARVLIGTPPNHCSGYFRDVTLPGSKWSVHHWTMLDNPFLADPKAEVAEVLAENGWDTSHPIFRREYMGEWVRSEESVAYSYAPERNDFLALPALPRGYGWSHVLGIDLGASETPKTAFTVWAFNAEVYQDTFALESYKTTRKTPSEIASEIGSIRERHGEVARIKLDYGGLGKAIAEEITKRHGIAVEPAEKTERNTAIELMDDDLRRGRIKVHPERCKDLIEEWKLLQWDEKRRKLDERFPDDAADSALYGWRECKQWLHEPPKEKPKRGSAAYWREVEDKIEAEAEEAFASEQGKEWWER